MNDLGLVIKEASQAVKAHNFSYALDLLNQNLDQDPCHIDSLYLAAFVRAICNHMSLPKTISISY